MYRDEIDVLLQLGTSLSLASMVRYVYEEKNCKLSRILPYTHKSIINFNHLDMFKTH